MSDRRTWTSNEIPGAQQAARSKWPRIVQNMVNEMGIAISVSEGSALREAETIRDSLAALQSSMTHGRALKMLEQDGAKDIADYNAEIERVSGTYTWKNCSELFVECYLYRYIQNLFSRSEAWRDHDVCKGEKNATYRENEPTFENMARKFLSIKKILPNSTEDDKRLVFIALTLVSMWGEPEGLALLENLPIDRLEDSRSQAVICEGLRYIVDNDNEAVWQYLQGQEGDDRVVDIILGDAGFELFADIIYAAYLIEAGMASKVNIHPKDFPWFVTNATASDISEAFLFLSPGDEHSHRDALNELVPHLRQLFESKKICVVQHPFWTTAYRYEEMDSWAPELFDSLQSSSLVIFKGELNYRKLTGDVAWHPSTDFKTSLGKLGRASNLQILALGRNKADTCVGVGENSLKVLEKKSPDGAWRTDGQYGKVSFSDGL